jgi:cytochrome c553
VGLYDITLLLHSWLRWAVLGLLVAVVVRSAIGVRGARAWSPADEGTHVAAVASVDLQLLVGLVLYVFLSPITSAFFGAPGASMRETTLRFFGVEHLTSMLLGVVALHVGRARSKRGPAAQRQKTVLRWTTAALVCVLVGIPWPFLRYGRPLARLGETTSAPSSGSCPPSYAARCATCHGGSGRGDGVAATTLRPPPRDFTTLAGRSDDELAAVIRDGGGAHGLSVAMPSHADLSEEELRALTACVRSFATAPGR